MSPCLALFVCVFVRALQASLDAVWNHPAMAATGWAADLPRLLEHFQDLARQEEVTFVLVTRNVNGAAWQACEIPYRFLLVCLFASIDIRYHCVVLYCTSCLLEECPPKLRSLSRTMIIQTLRLGMACLVLRKAVIVPHTGRPYCTPVLCWAPRRIGQGD